MEQEHASIDPALEGCRSGLQRLAETRDSDTHAALIVRMTATKEALHRHLAHEETDTMALLQRVLLPAEWHEMDEKFKRSFTARQLTWAVPWIVAELPDEVRRALFDQPGAAPLKVVQLMFGRRFAKLQRSAFRYIG
jgi:hypothetical protein